jgi:hypothetical protein
VADLLGKAGTLNITIEQGATFSMPVQLSSGGLVADGGTPVNLTGCSIRMHIRKRIADLNPLLALTTGGGQIVITDAGQGKFTVTITDEVTAALAWTAGVYDLEVESSGGEVTRYLQGKVKVSKEVTRA